MSAFQCSPEHIAAVATFGAASVSQAKLIASLLTEANAASVAYRYREAADVPEVSTHAVMRYFYNPLPPAEVLKLISCIGYQSCEVPGWDSNYASAILDAIRQAAIMARFGDSGTGDDTIRADPQYQAAEWAI